MRVILGKAGKSRILEREMLNFKKDKIILVDTVGVPALHQYAEWVASPKDLVEMAALFTQISMNEELSHIEVIALELNTSIEETRILLEWEQRLGKRFIVTVQENSVDNIMVFDMTNP